MWVCYPPVMILMTSSCAGERSVTCDKHQQKEMQLESNSNSNSNSVPPHHDGLRPARQLAEHYSRNSGRNKDRSKGSSSYTVATAATTTASLVV